jgi:hypothetical protein
VKANAKARDRDSGVAGIVAAVLLLAIFVAFLAVVNVSWIPVWVKGSEASSSDGLRSALTGWADDAEDLAARGLANRTFTATLPIGSPGLPVLNAGATPGVLGVDGRPTASLYLNGTLLATVTGGLVANTSYQRFPSQNFRYALGALEVDNGNGTWVDLRSVLSPGRASRGNVTLAVQLTGVSGPVGALASPGEVQAVTTLQSAWNATEPGGVVRLLVANVSADSWRAAVDRTFNSAGLVGERAAGCGSSTKAYCLDTNTNNATVLDVYLPKVYPWLLAVGTLRVEVRG